MKIKGLVRAGVISVGLGCLSFWGPNLLADGPAFSGFVDTTYNYNFNKPDNQTNALRSFDAKTNNIALNAAQLQGTGTVGDVTYVIKLLAGTDALAISPIGADGGRAATLSNPGSQGADYFDLEEAYATYKFNPNLNFKVGKFVTLEGIEVIESKDNPTISRGSLFGMAEPYTHVGGLLDYTFLSKYDVGLGVVNGWDIVNDNNRGKTLIGKIGLNYGDPLTLTISGLLGPEQPDSINTAFATNTIHRDGNVRSSLDAVLVTKIIPNVTLNIQGNVGTEKRAFDPTGAGLIGATTNLRDSWSGAGIQPVVTITKKFSIGGRLEYMYDKWGTRMAPLPVGGVADHLATTNFTITPGYKLTDNTMVRAEYRYDKSNRKVYQDQNGTLKDNDSTVSAEWIVTF